MKARSSTTLIERRDECRLPDAARSHAESSEVRLVTISAAFLTSIAIGLLSTRRFDIGECTILFANYLQIAAFLWIFTGLIALMAAMVITSRRGDRQPSTTIIHRFISERWSDNRCLSVIWPPIAFALLLTIYNAYKQLILPNAGTPFGPVFASIDRKLFLDHEPWRVVHSVFSSPWATYGFDLAYHAWFLPMSLAMIACAWSMPGQFQLKAQYLFTYIGIWTIIGGVFAYLLPAGGPAFFAAFAHGDRFLPLLARLASDEAVIRHALPGARLASLEYQHGLLAIYGSEHLAMGGGISAMPSVHNALAVLFALAARRVNRRLGWFMAGYAVLIWLGSIDLGWHFAVDGVVAAGMTIYLWLISGRIATYLAGPQAATARPERVNA